MAQGQGLIFFWYLEFNEERSNPNYLLCEVHFSESLK